MRLGAIILHFGSLSNTKKTLISLKPRLDHSPIYLVNNTTADVSELSRLYSPLIIINNPKNLGFAAGVNIGLKRALADGLDAFFLLNNDLEWTQGSLKQLMVVFAKHPKAGIIAPVLGHGQLYDWGAKLSRWSGMLKHLNFPSPPKTNLNVEHVAAAAIIIKKEVIDQIGFFDERYFLYYEDLDFMLRAKDRGYQIILTPQVILRHAVSSGTRLTKRTLYQWHSHLKFVTKHLFKNVYPSAYLSDLILYPLYLLKSFF